MNKIMNNKIINKFYTITQSSTKTPETMKASPKKPCIYLAWNFSIKYVVWRIPE